MSQCPGYSYELVESSHISSLSKELMLALAAGFEILFLSQHIYALIVCPEAQYSDIYEQMYSTLFFFFACENAHSCHRSQRTHAEADLLSRHNEDWVRRLAARSPFAQNMIYKAELCVRVCVDSRLFMPCFILLLMALSPSRLDGGVDWQSRYAAGQLAMTTAARAFRVDTCHQHNSTWFPWAAAVPGHNAVAAIILASHSALPHPPRLQPLAHLESSFKCARTCCCACVPSL